MRKPPDQSAADAGRRRPDYVIELAVNPDLRGRPVKPRLHERRPPRPSTARRPSRTPILSLPTGGAEP